MTVYTSNRVRNAAIQSLLSVIRNVRQSARVSEVAFRDEFLDALKDPALGICWDGWYSPPPFGTSVLFGHPPSTDRISFSSLRHEPYWPRADVTCDTRDGALYFYCSPVDARNGLIGDFATTLYFGSDATLLGHFWNCFDAVQSLLSELPHFRTSGEIFRFSQELFARRNLTNCVVSVTDTVVLDLGHTFPSLKSHRADVNRGLTPQERDELRRARRFLNAVTDWPLDEGLQFSIEPQLRSSTSPSLPQITFHHLIEVGPEGRLTVCRGVDQIVEEFMSR